MTGLLLKDFYNIRKQIVWYAAMIIIFCILSAVSGNISFAAAIGLLLTVSIPLTAIAYEEKESWQKFVIASGVSAKTAVMEKYILGIIFSAVSALGYLIIFIFSAGENPAWFEFVNPVCMQFIMLSVILPLIFKFGVEKGRTYAIVLVVVMMVLFVGLLSLTGELTAVSETVICLVFIAVAAAAFVVSCVISVKIYSRKEF